MKFGLEAGDEMMPCDCCEQVVLCRLFGTFHLCAVCLERAVGAIGLEAAGRAIERLSDLSLREQEMRKALEDTVEFINRVFSDAMNKSHELLQLLEDTSPDELQRARERNRRQ